MASTLLISLYVLHLAGYRSVRQVEAKAGHHTFHKRPNPDRCRSHT